MPSSQSVQFISLGVFVQTTLFVRHFLGKWAFHNNPSWLQDNAPSLHVWRTRPRKQAIIRPPLTLFDVHLPGDAKLFRAQRGKSSEFVFLRWSGISCFSRLAKNLEWGQHFYWPALRTLRMLSATGDYRKL